MSRKRKYPFNGMSLNDNFLVLIADNGQSARPNCGDYAVTLNGCACISIKSGKVCKGKIIRVKK